jgi:hypothetical protein
MVASAWFENVLTLEIIPKKIIIWGLKVLCMY